MSRVSVAERARLSVFAGARDASQPLGRVKSRRSADPLALLPGKPDRLLIAPQDLRTADATRASEIYAGRFAFAGKVVICDGRSPFEIDAAVGGMGGRRCTASAGCAICAPPTPASRAPMRARWSTNGSRCKARWQRGRLAARGRWRAASSPG